MKNKEFNIRETFPKIMALIKCENGLNIEIYEDGDCLLNYKSQAFVQLSADLIARLAQISRKTKYTIKNDGRSSKSIKPKNETMNLQNPALRRMAPEESSSSNIRCSIHKFADQDGWQCLLSTDTGLNEVHIYATRTQARQARLGACVGENGRLA